MTGRRGGQPAGRGPVSRIGPPPAMKLRSPLEAALAYAELGWAVLPVAGLSAGECGCGKPCGSPAKHPVTRHGVHDASSDPVLIREWWRRTPGANVGSRPGGPRASSWLTSTYPGAAENPCGSSSRRGPSCPRRYGRTRAAAGYTSSTASPRAYRSQTRRDVFPALLRRCPGLTYGDRVATWSRPRASTPAAGGTGGITARSPPCRPGSGRPLSCDVQRPRQITPVRALGRPRTAQLHWLDRSKA